MAASDFLIRNDFCSWGRVTREPQRVASPRFRAELPGLIERGCRQSILPVGLRRSYGDTCLNGAGALIDMCGLDRLISLDLSSGVFRAEAGISLSEILRLCAPHGWFLPTTPGTRFVTLGGAVANDLHGKDHHSAGSFGRHVRSLGLLRSDGSRRAITQQSDPGLFAATIGGLGLTGVIEWVEIELQRIESAWLDVETIPFGDLAEFWSLAAESAVTHKHTVSWIDCSRQARRGARGIFSRANWRADREFAAHGDGAWKSVPLEAPSSLLNRFSVAAFNEAYFRFNSSKTPARQHYSSFFYPLDAVNHWNRLYGRRGMYQYQCVIPPKDAEGAIASLLEEIGKSGQASFLSVLKTFGDRPSPGFLSFPRPGATLALDFPNRGEETLRLLARLDAIVEEAEGALYPAKDGRMPAPLFKRAFPRWPEFLDYKDPMMNSDFWRRVTA